MMKKILFLFLATISLGACTNTPLKEDERTKLFEEFNNRYTLGLIFQDYMDESNTYKYDDVEYGVVIKRIMPETDASRHLNVGNVVSEINGRLLNGSKSHNEELMRAEVLSSNPTATIKYYDGKAFSSITLSKSKAGDLLFK